MLRVIDFVGCASNDVTFVIMSGSPPSPDWRGTRQQFITQRYIFYFYSFCEVNFFDLAMSDIIRLYID